MPSKAYKVVENVGGWTARWIGLTITIFAIIIISIGAWHAALEYFGIDVSWLPTPHDIPQFKTFPKNRRTKIILAEAVSVSLSFLLAATIVHLTVAPDYYVLGIMGILIILHLAISYSVNKEISDATSQQLELKAIPLHPIKTPQR